MTRRATVLIICAGLATLGCQESGQPTGPEIQPQLSNNGILASVTGGGHNRGSNLDIKFSFSALQTDADGSGTGQFRFSVIFQGELVEFHGRVTCVTFDAQNSRAWVGGVITENNSTHPFWTQDINDVGRDIWFRAVDYGEGDNAPQMDRNTFVGFEGNAGIITSAEYCDAKIWPDGDARTNAVSQGDVQVQVSD